MIFLVFSTLFILLFLVIFIFNVQKNMQLVSKNNAVYFLPLFFSLLFLHLYTYEYTLQNINFQAFISAIESSISIFGIKINFTFFEAPLTQNLYFSCLFYISALFAILTSFTFVFAFFLPSCLNFLRKIKLSNKELDVLLSFGDQEKEYIKQHPSTIVWIQANEVAQHSSYFYSHKIAYVKKDFTIKNIIGFLRFQRRKINFVEIQKNNTITYAHLQAYVDTFKSLNSEVKKRFYLENILFFANIHKENQKLLKRVFPNSPHSPKIICFDQYSLIAENFASKHPLSSYLNSNDFDASHLIKPDKVFSVLFIGFGRVNEELYKKLVPINQLPTKDKDGKFVPHLIQYYGFDTQPTQFENRDLNHNVHRFQQFIAREKDLSKYYEFPSPVSNFIPKMLNVNLASFYPTIEQILEKSDFSMIIISYGEDMENIDLSLKLSDRINEWGYASKTHLFCRTKSDIYQKNIIKDQLTFFGFSNLMNHKDIVREELHHVAMQIHASYAKITDEKEKLKAWRELTAFQKESNISAALNFHTKLDYLELTVTDKKTNASFSKEAFLSKINPENIDFSTYYNVSNLEKPLLLDLLSIQEHLRWNAFHLMEGYLPLLKDKVQVSFNEFTKNIIIENKNVVEKYHACLTTIEGLHDYHQQTAKLLVEKEYVPEFSTALNFVNTYVHDYKMILNLYDYITACSKYLIEKKG